MLLPQQTVKSATEMTNYVIYNLKSHVASSKTVKSATE